MTAPLTVHDEPFERVRGEWTGLLQQLDEPIPFVTPVWQKLWLDQFLGDRRLRVLTARDGERLIGIAPIIADGDRVEFVGHYSICDYMDVAVTPGFEHSFFASIFAQLCEDGVKSADLRGLRANSPSLEAICETAATAGFVVAREDEALSPRVTLPATWDDYLGTLSKHDRHEMRRKMRRLGAGGNVELKIITEAEEADANLATLFHLMRISNHHKEEFLDRPGMEAFFREMTRTMANEGMLRFYFLTMDGAPAASVLNFDLGGTLYMYNSGYDPALSHYAVGLMSKALLIKDAIETGRVCVDFMRGDESYKYDLGGKDLQVYRLQLSR